MPCLTIYMDNLFCAVALPIWTMWSPASVQNKQSHGCSCHGCRTGTLWNLPNPASGTYTSTLRNPPEPASATYTSPRQNSPELAATFRNPPEPSGTCPPAHTGTSPELFGILRNLPEPASGILQNLLEPTSGTHTGTLQKLPEPSSGTCSCDPHRHTPELIWAEDPIGLRCWGKNKDFIRKVKRK